MRSVIAADIPKDFGVTLQGPLANCHVKWRDRVKQEDAVDDNSLPDCFLVHEPTVCATAQVVAGTLEAWATDAHRLEIG